MAVLDPEGIAVAHSDPSKIGTPFRPHPKVIHLGPELEENWDLVPLGEDGQVFEVHRRFEPLKSGRGPGFGRMRRMMHWHGEMQAAPDDWYTKLDQQEYLIVVGLDVAPFQEAIREDIRTTVVLSVVLLLSGFGGFVSIFWMNSYRTTKRTLQDTSAFANEVVSHLPVGLIATNREGQITFFNPEAGKITGLDPALAKGRAPDSILPAQLCGLQQERKAGQPP